MDNLLSLNDNWYFSATDYIGGDGQDKSSSSYSLNLTLPYGYWSYGLSASHSDYGSTVEAASGPFQTSGDADSQALKVSRIISRGKTSKTTLSLNLTAKQNNSLLEDVRLASSSRKLTLFDVGINHALRGSGSTWSLTLNYSRGLDLFDALVDGPDSGNDIPKAQFEKLAWDISVQLPLAAGEGDWSYQGTWSGQLSADPLFGSEQLAIGDLGSVRGFRDSPLSGDSGLYFKNDLNWRPGFSLAWLKNMTLTLGLDLGYISAKNDNIQGSGEGQASLAGLALGLQQSLGLGGQQSLNWSLLLGTPLSAPAFIVQENFVVYFDLSWSIR